jgi:hypothetical protein
MTLGPVLLTVDPPRTAKLCEVPRDICANAGIALKRAIVNSPQDRGFILDLPSFEVVRWNATP